MIMGILVIISVPHTLINTLRYDAFISHSRETITIALVYALKFFYGLQQTCLGIIIGLIVLFLFNNFDSIVCFIRTKSQNMRNND